LALEGSLGGLGLQAALRIREPLALLEQFLFEFGGLPGVELVDQGFDLALFVVLRVNEPRLHRLRHLDLAVALAVPEDIDEVLDAQRRAELPAEAAVVGHDLRGVAHRATVPLRQAVH
jgi:hypothetical protein